jgi:hypothetical protein
MNLDLTDEQKEVPDQVSWPRRGCDREPPVARGFVLGWIDDLDNVRRGMLEDQIVVRRELHDVHPHAEAVGEVVSDL